MGRIKNCGWCLSGWQTGISVLVAIAAINLSVSAGDDDPSLDRFLSDISNAKQLTITEIRRDANRPTITQELMAEEIKKLAEKCLSDSKPQLGDARELAKAKGIIVELRPKPGQNRDVLFMADGTLYLSISTLLISVQLKDASAYEFLERKLYNVPDDQSPKVMKLLHRWTKVAHGAMGRRLDDFVVLSKGEEIVCLSMENDLFYSCAPPIKSELVWWPQYAIRGKPHVEDLAKTFLRRNKLIVSPDQEWALAYTDASAGGLSTLRRNPKQNNQFELAWLSKFGRPIPQEDWTWGAFSADGKQIYGYNFAEQLLVVQELNQKTGELKLLQAFQGPERAEETRESELQRIAATPQAGLTNVTGLAASADGRSVYVISKSEHTLSTYERQEDGRLKFVELIEQSQRPRVKNEDLGLGMPWDLSISPDGTSLYVADHGGQIGIWDRDTKTGRLKHKRIIASHHKSQGDLTHLALDGVSHVRVSPRGNALAAMCSPTGAVLLFSRGKDGDLRLDDKIYYENKKSAEGNATVNLVNIRFDETGKMLYAADWEGTFRVAEIKESDR